MFERLREWRLARASEDGVPAFVVFTDATLIAIAEKRPSNAGELSRISGVGVRKLQRYGPSVLEVLEGIDPQQAAERCCAAMESEESA